MKTYNVTLNFSFTPRYWDDDWGLDSRNTEAKKKAYERTDKYYEDHDIIEYIKTNDAMGMVENIFYDAEVMSAKWDPSSFAIHMVVETDQMMEELKEDLEMNSLEDGEYEACGETGWILLTRGENGEIFGPPWDMKDTWEYGTTDYRQNPISIREVS